MLRSTGVIRRWNRPNWEPAPCRAAGSHRSTDRRRAGPSSPDRADSGTHGDAHPVHCRPLTGNMQSVVSGPTTRIEGRLTRADRDRDPYVLVPFRVPGNVHAVRLRLRHDPAGDADRPDVGAVIDLGVIGPGSTAIGTDAFRGWSGSERDVVTIGERWATPGYLAGPIVPGIWHAILGLYGIPDAGAAFWLDIEVTDARSAPPAATPRMPRPDVVSTAPQPASAEDHRRWLACDLHAHSVHSDGVDELAALGAAAGQRCLDALFVSDHNTTSHHRWLDGAVAGNPEVELLPAEEVTTYHGHLNAIGSTDWVDFRHRDRAGLVAAIDAVHRSGGLASVNHPRRNPCSWEWGDVPMDLVEVWNGSWSDANEAGLAWWYELVAARAAAADPHPPAPVGGSDCHDASQHAAPPGTPTTWVSAAAATRDAIVAGLAAARIALTASPAEQPPRIRRHGARVVWDLPAAPDRHLVLRGAAGVSRRLALDGGSRAEWRVAAAEPGTTAVAAEIRGTDDRLHALVPLIDRGG